MDETRNVVPLATVTPEILLADFAEDLQKIKNLVIIAENYDGSISSAYTDMRARDLTYLVEFFKVAAVAPKLEPL